MSTNGAYPNEMQEVEFFTHALRAAVPVQPRRELTATIVPRLAATARGATIVAETQATTSHAGLPVRRSRRALVAKIAVAAASIPLLLAGLAFAGVTVPGPARDAFDSLGITLPNQPSADDNASEAAQKATQKATQKTSQGTAPKAAGNDVSNAAHTKAKGKGGNSAAAHEHALEQHEKAQGEANGHSRGKAIGLNDSTPPSHFGQTGPPPQSNAGGNRGGSSAGHSQGKPPTATPAPNDGAQGPPTTLPGRSKEAP